MTETTRIANLVLGVDKGTYAWERIDAARVLAAQVELGPGGDPGDRREPERDAGVGAPGALVRLGPVQHRPDDRHA